MRMAGSPRSNCTSVGTDVARNAALSHRAARSWPRRRGATRSMCLATAQQAHTPVAGVRCRQRRRAKEGAGRTESDRAQARGGMGAVSEQTETKGKGGEQKDKRGEGKTASWNSRPINQSTPTQASRTAILDIKILRQTGDSGPALAFRIPSHTPHSAPPHIQQFTLTSPRCRPRQSIAGRPPRSVRRLTAKNPTPLQRRAGPTRRRVR
eukprot:365300-Chlamydomonas_euryale.AAC.7